MKFPNHIILDWNSSNIENSSKYWIFRNNFTSNQSTHNYYINFSLKNNFYKSYFFISNKNNFFKNFSKYTINYNKNLKNNLSNFEKINFSFFLKKNNIKEVYLKNNFKKLNNFFYFNENNYINKNDSLWTFFDINFLRKEKIYTKLKYSRVPQYDIVSGGVAAIFAGFLGFLICEKFGFELLDSGDFYIFFMYMVFFCFFSKLYLKLFSYSNDNWSILSPKWLLFFYKDLVILFFKVFVKKSK